MNMRKRTFSLFLYLLVIVFLQQPLKAQLIKPDTLDIVYTKDFSLDGTGVNYNWGKAHSISLQQLDEGLQGYETKFKVMYSAKGIYVLFTGKDLKSTSSYKNDFDDLYNADVFEVFLHPDPSTPLYFEYEVSPKDKELVLLIPNIDGKIMGWLPWHYEGERKVKKKIAFSYENKQLIGWSVELFFPYALLSPMRNIPPTKGTIWHGNFYRLDYDAGPMVKWAWSPVEKSFHEVKRFGVLRFE